MIVYLFTTLFYLLLFLIICGIVCGPVCANGDSAQLVISEKTTVIFKTHEEFNALCPTDNKDQKKNKNKIKIFAENYYFPFFLSAGDIIMAVTEVNYKVELQKHFDILTNYTEIKETSGTTNIESIYSNWNTQLVFQSTIEQNRYGGNAQKIMGVATEDKIYILLVNCTVTTEGSTLITTYYDNLKLFVGTIDNKESSKKTIDWKEEPSLINGASKKLKKEFKNVDLSDMFFNRFAFVTKEKDTVFLLVMQSMETANATLLHLKKSNENEDFVYKKITEDCYSHFFLLNNKIFMLPIKCTEEETKKIMALNDLDGNWEEHTGPLSRLQSFLKDKENFFEATINDKHLLLFTKDKPIDDEKKEIYLWMTDGSRVGCVGAIATTDITGLFYWSFLYTKEKLFALHEYYDSETYDHYGENDIYLTHFNEQEKNITNTLDTWKESNDKIQQLCKDNSITKIPCLTDGLVGFLSDNKEKNNKIWKDWYLNVNATVKNGEQIKDGFSFNTKGAGAIWPVGSSLKDQPYDFANFGFTLLVTVKIGKHTGNSENSILGVKIDDDKVIRLWCTSDGKWKINKEQIRNNENNVAASKESCEQENVYQIAITYEKNNNLFFYIDRNKLSSINEGLSIQKFGTVTHFYFGVDNSEGSSQSISESSVKVTNVLLYNFPLTTDYCKQIKATKNNNDNSQYTECNENSNYLLDKSTPPKNNTDNTLLQTGENAVNIKIFVSINVGLLFLFFGVDVCARF